MRVLITLLIAVVTYLVIAVGSVGGYTAQVIPTGISRINADNLIRVEMDVDVAILDTGVYSKHVDLNVAGGFDCTDNDNWEDVLGHGTHVAGIIGAKDNDVGVMGVAPGARIWAIRVFDEYGYSTNEMMLCGLHWVYFHKDVIDVVNLSLGALLPDGVSLSCEEYLKDGESLSDNVGGPTNPMDIYEPPLIEDSIHNAICRLDRAGIVIVAAAGNEGRPIGRAAPAFYDEVIAVSSMADYDGKPGSLSPMPDGASCFVPATVTDDSFYSTINSSAADAWFFGYSNNGEAVDIAAPGVCILSTWLDGGYTVLTGTSMAAPHVTGAIAYFLSVNPDASPKEAKEWLLSTASVPQKTPNGFRFDVDAYPEPMLCFCSDWQ